MKKRTIIRGILISLILFIVFWLPFLIILIMSQYNTFHSINDLPDSDAIIIFGAHITDNQEVSPLLKERLDAGTAIFNEGKIKTIVVSNTEKAAQVMAEYLEDQGIPPKSIEIDTQAVATPDTCTYEIEQHPEKRKLILISQGFHLPRLLYQCSKIGVNGIAFPAESIESIDRSQYSLYTIISTRTNRYLREAALTWLSIVGIY